MNPYALLLAFLAGSVLTFAITRLYLEHERTQSELADLKEQVKGKALSYTVRNGLLDILANENYEQFDLDLAVKHHRALGDLIETMFERQRRRRQLNEQIYHGKYDPDKG